MGIYAIPCLVCVWKDKPVLWVLVLTVSVVTGTTCVTLTTMRTADIVTEMQGPAYLVVALMRTALVSIPPPATKPLILVGVGATTTAIEVLNIIFVTFQLTLVLLRINKQK